MVEYDYDCTWGLGIFLSNAIQEHASDWKKKTTKKVRIQKSSNKAMVIILFYYKEMVDLLYASDSKADETSLEVNVLFISNQLLQLISTKT